MTVPRYGTITSALLLKLLVLVMLVSASGCKGSAGLVHKTDKGSFSSRPKYIFLFIGDGMGMAQVKLSDAVLDSGNVLAMGSFPVTGVTATHAENRYITDSGAAGTALATGFKTSIGTISMKSNHRDTLRTIAEMAKQKGMRVGIVSSVGIDNATPACFYAHNAGRGNYHDIAMQMATSGFDYFGGGYAEGDFAHNRSKEGAIKRDIPSVMKAADYRVTTGREDLLSVVPGTRCWAYTRFDGKAALSYAMDREGEELSLAEFTRQGIRLLENPAGFFMMVEGGKIDWACHANDAAATAHDVAAFDRAIAEAVAFYRLHPDETLIVVTADHECGGLSLGNAMQGYESRLPLLRRQKISQERFSQKVAAWKKSGKVTFAMALDSVKVYYGLGYGALDPALAISLQERKILGDAYQANHNAVPGAERFASVVTGMLNSRAGIGWTSNVHTAVPVPVFAAGAGAEAFGGSYDNTGIAEKIMRLARIGGRQ
ncbi:MAG: alkaline phosphatase [Chlorobium sp.]|uniref:alkaline phosphatase n=1 Tax=Chlorobium sp. TaxID=1095 RepID=UPI0025BC9DCF|nr:alkaline phosphatase [Chlorobium sp.]MCF8384034.1 alkaline phosphatase [Chlorobium sp.]